MINVEAYKCDHCSMTSLRKYSVKRHENETCRKNPNRKTCANCKNLEFEPEEGYYCDEIESIIEHPVNISMDCRNFSLAPTKR